MATDRKKSKPMYSATDEDARTDLASHKADTNNPHGVTTQQIGALPLSGGDMAGELTAYQRIHVKDFHETGVTADPFINFVDASDTRLGYIGFGATNSNYMYIHNSMSGKYIRLQDNGIMSYDGDVTFDNGLSTEFKVQCDSDGIAWIMAQGDSQGSAGVFVGQSNDYGGGIGYQGDNTGVGIGDFEADKVTLFRRDNGVDYWVMYYSYNSTTVVFRGNVGGYSDRRLKDNLEVISNPIEKVKQLTGYTFDRVDENNKREAGLIAQDVREILPEVVFEDNDEDKTLSLEYGKLAGLWVETFKAQQKMIEDLQEEVRKLKEVV